MTIRASFPSMSNSRSRGLSCMKVIFFSHAKGRLFSHGAIEYTRKSEQLDQCCQQLVAMLCCTLSTTVADNRCSQLFTVNNHCSIIVDNHQQACFINYYGLLFQQALEQLQFFFVNTKQILIDYMNIVNSTGVVELTMRQRDQRAHQRDQFLRVFFRNQQFVPVNTFSSSGTQKRPMCSFPIISV